MGRCARSAGRRAGQRALALIDDDELVAWTQALTRINSVWRPELGLGEEEAARWVEARCREIGLETYFEVVQPGRPNVIALLRGLLNACAGDGVAFSGIHAGDENRACEGDVIQ